MARRQLVESGATTNAAVTEADFYPRQRVRVVSNGEPCGGYVQAIDSHGHKVDVRIDHKGHKHNGRIVKFDPAAVQPE
jgi:hypothetical protein